MAIDTDNKKLAVMDWGNIWEPGLPLSPGALGQDDQQQLLWGYPGILWGALTEVIAEPIRAIFTLDKERRIFTLDNARRIFTLDKIRRIFNVD